MTAKPHRSSRWEIGLTYLEKIDLLPETASIGPVGKTSKSHEGLSPGATADALIKGGTDAALLGAQISVAGPSGHLDRFSRAYGIDQAKHRIALIEDFENFPPSIAELAMTCTNGEISDIRHRIEDSELNYGLSGSALLPAVFNEWVLVRREKGT
jgi:hypothetical protein